ncbi:BKACE family enzyme [Streptomyces rugosispiralis]|uniref:3-keto-5-aminohexanoate cleavage protein n=1 Tax=Streptomyces rugosispiralis TaxID=2967341 RepID=A0ABT1UPT3_9ACTN|nr:3-keto-5-aminohexanoate cleavage protein [Streptomyces rugosispiralis]MCQ8186748.1 3-keto-5-aminohexanoate cleavage protein [Streptomyces rugosispiralis]
MKSVDQTIISCAVTGSIHTPSMSDALPFTPEDIAAQALGAAGAGAAVLHLHARDPLDGRPSSDPEVFRRFLVPIATGSDAVVNITTGGAATMTLDDRLAAARTFAPELASLNMGSMNFNFAPAVGRISDWRHGWERDYLLGSADRIFSNTFTQIETVLNDLGERGTRFEFECYDIGHLYSLAHFVERGLVRPPFLIQGVFGVLGGIGPDLDHVQHMVRTADRLFGQDYLFSAFGAGRHQFAVATHAAQLGGHVRVGLEDGLHVGAGRLARNNAEQVEKIVRILAEMGRTPATPDQARELLALKGRANTDLPGSVHATVHGIPAAS